MTPPGSQRREVCLYICYDERDDFMLSGVESMTIGNVKAERHDVLGIPPDQQRLTLSDGIGALIEDNPGNAKTLANYNIQSLVHILVQAAAVSVRERLCNVQARRRGAAHQTE